MDDTGFISTIPYLTSFSIAYSTRDISDADWREFAARPENSPEALEAASGVPAAEVRAAARLYATGVNGRKNAAIYYGLGVTEHSRAAPPSWASPTSPWPPATSAAKAWA